MAERVSRALPRTAAVGSRRIAAESLDRTSVCVFSVNGENQIVLCFRFGGNRRPAGGKDALAHPKVTDRRLFARLNDAAGLRRSFALGNDVEIKKKNTSPTRDHTRYVNANHLYAATLHHITKWHPFDDGGDQNEKLEVALLP